MAISILLIAVIVSCSKNAEDSYSYETLDKVTYTVNTKKLKYYSDTKSVFLYFELIINNNFTEAVYIDIGKIKANLNGELSAATYYDSLASVMPNEEELQKGESIRKLYFVFSENLRGKDLKEFEVTNYGLIKK